MDDKKRLVEVCSECSMASCWHGVHMCWESTNAGTITKTVEQLDSADLEHKDYYSKENIKKLFGDEAPHGYET